MKKPKTPKAKKAKLKKVFDEGKAGQLRSGSKQGPKVAHGSKQEIAIALSEAGMSRKKKRKRKTVGDVLSR